MALLNLPYVHPAIIRVWVFQNWAEEAEAAAQSRLHIGRVQLSAAPSPYIAAVRALQYFTSFTDIFDINKLLYLTG